MGAIAKDVVAEKFDLSFTALDAVSARFVEIATARGMYPSSQLRLRLFLEDVLTKYHDRLPENTPVTLELRPNFIREDLRIIVRGPELPPEALKEDGDEADALFDNIQDLAGQKFSHSYQNGSNVFTLSFPKRSVHNFCKSLLAMVLAVASGLLVRQYPGSGTDEILKIANTVFDTFLGGLTALAGPLVFLTIFCGIINLNDINAFKTTFKGCLRKMLGSYLLVGGLAVAILYQFYPVASAGDAGNGKDAPWQIVGMFADIIPHNLLTPFIEGKMLQIIFLGFVEGAIVLCMGGKTAAIKKIAEQGMAMVIAAISAFSRFGPFFVFFCFFLLTVNCGCDQLNNTLHYMLFTLAGAYLVTGLGLLRNSLRYKISPLLLARKLASPHFLSLTTASSMVAYPVMLDTLEKKLGVSPSIARLSLSLHMSCFAPATLIGYISASVVMAASAGVPMSYDWIVLMLVVCIFMAVSCPPVPGGSLIILGALFRQLGIPPEYVSLVLSVEMLMDNPLTANDVSGCQLQVLLAAKDIGKVDENVLRGGEIGGSQLGGASPA